MGPEPSGSDSYCIIIPIIGRWRDGSDDRTHFLTRDGLPLGHMHDRGSERPGDSVRSSGFLGLRGRPAASGVDLVHRQRAGSRNLSSSAREVKSSRCRASNPCSA